MVIRDLSTLNRVTRIIRWATIRKTEMEKSKKKLEIDRPDRRRSNISFPFSSFSFVQTNCAKRNFHETEVAFETFDGHGAIEVCEKQTAGEGGGGSSLFNY